MKHSNWFIIATFILVWLSGCGRPGDPRSFRGLNEMSADTESFIASSQKQTWNQKNVEIVRGHQMLGPAIIEQTWFQGLRANDGNWKYVAGEYLGQPPKELLERVEAIYEASDIWLARTRIEHPLLRDAKSVEEPFVVVTEGFSGFEPQLRVRFVTAHETDVKELWWNERGRVIRVRSVAHFADGVAMVFPGSPERTNLSDQILRELTGDGTLTSQLLKLESALAHTPFSQAHEFRYTPDQSLFDDVQAYYFADRTVKWFESTLELKYPRQLHVRVHIGGVTPSNAAFYYDGRVRLGDGDGKSYQGIPRDPSIVTHEVCHAFVEMLSGLPFEGEGGSYSEAFADFLTASRLNDPRMGAFAYLKGPHTRTLENTKSAATDFNGGLYNDSLVISGTFWDLRKALGEEASLKLAKSFLMRIGPGGKLADFVPVMSHILQQEEWRKDAPVVLEVLRKRGWTQ